MTDLFPTLRGKQNSCCTGAAVLGRRSGRVPRVADEFVISWALRD